MSALITALEKNNFKKLEPRKRSTFWDSLFTDPQSHVWFVLENPEEFTNEQLILLKTPEHATGHTGISHGGLIATLFDEPLCYAAYPVLPHHTGVTASLTVNYQKPTPAGSWVLLKAKALGKEGSRKATVNAEIYPADPSNPDLPWETSGSLASAVQIVVEPKWHAELDHK